MAPWAQHVYGADADWWNLHYLRVKEQTSAKCWSQDVQNGLVFDHPEGIEVVESCGGDGLQSDRLVRGLNSGYQAINLAYYLGATRVLLLGYDMKGRGQHFFGKHPQGLRNDTDYSHFLVWFDRMNPEEHGLEVINCTRDSALTCFPRMDIHEALGL